MTRIEIKRVYETPSDEDGFRILVDRLWPRGLSKEKARVDVWAKNIAPSSELRRSFGHEPARWDEFRHAYLAELAANDSALAQWLLVIGMHERVTLVYGAKETRYNDAVVLKACFEEHLRAGAAGREARHTHAPSRDSGNGDSVS